MFHLFIKNSKRKQQDVTKALPYRAFLRNRKYFSCLTCRSQKQTLNHTVLYARYPHIDYYPIADSIDYKPDREHTAGEGCSVHLDVHGREQDVTGHSQQLVLLQTHLLKEAHRKHNSLYTYIY